MVISLGAVLYSCASHPLNRYNTTKVDIAMLDTISNNRFSSFAETTEETFFLGFIRVNIYQNASEHAPISQNELDTLFKEQGQEEPLYDKKRMRLLINPKVSNEVDLKYLGIYKLRRTIIQGVSVNSLSQKELEGLIENIK